jgi:hypothetical protein
MPNIPSAAKAALICVEVTSVQPEGHTLQRRRTLQNIKYQKPQNYSSVHLQRQRLRVVVLQIGHLDVGGRYARYFIFACNNIAL